MEDFVTFEIAKKLKKNGFNGGCYKYYENKELKWSNSPWLESEYNNYMSHIVAAPVISQVLKWLREKYFIHISTKPYLCEDGIMWMYEIRKFSTDICLVVANKTGFIKEEQATIAGIEYCLNNLI